jgi:MoxR-like ATPase
MNSRDIAGIELLSEALKDRLERVVVPYPTESEEIAILNTYGKKIVDVPLDVKKKIIRICQITRADQELEFPASPRSAIAMYELSQCFTRLRKSFKVNEEDLSNAIRLALLGRLTPGTDSDYFNKTENYIEKLKKEIYAD